MHTPHTQQGNSSRPSWYHDAMAGKAELKLEAARLEQHNWARRSHRHDNATLSKIVHHVTTRLLQPLALPATLAAYSARSRAARISRATTLVRAIALPAVAMNTVFSVFTTCSSAASAVTTADEAVTNEVVSPVDTESNTQTSRAAPDRPWAVQAAVACAHGHTVGRAGPGAFTRVCALQLQPSRPCAAALCSAYAPGTHSPPPGWPAAHADGWPAACAWSAA